MSTPMTVPSTGPEATQRASRSPNLTGDTFLFECHFSQLLLENTTRTSGCGGMAGSWQQSRLEASMMEMVLTWAERGGEDPRQTLDALEEPPASPTATQNADDATSPFRVGEALRIRMTEQKVAVEIATRLHASRHPEEEKESRESALPWGYPPAGASGMAMAAWSEVERFLGARSQAPGLGEMAERLAALRPTSRSGSGMPVPSNQEEKKSARELYAPVWQAVGERIQRVQEEMTQLQSLMMESRNPLREGMLELLLTGVRERSEGLLPTEDHPPTEEKMT